MATLQVLLQAMQQRTGGAGARIDDAAKAFKNLGDQVIFAAQKLAGPDGFGPALTNLAREIQTILAPIAALLDWLMKLPEPTKELIVNLAAGTAAVVAFAGAWSIFSTIAGPAITAITGIGGALAKALLAVLTNPELLLAMATVTAFVVGFVQLYPEQAKRLEDSATQWVGGLWQKLKDKVGAMARESGLLPKAIQVPGVTTTGPITRETADNLKAVQDQVQQWSDAAAKTMLQALSSPAEAVVIKYKELFDKLDQLIHDKRITSAHADELRAQLTAAQEMESEAKLFEKRKQDIAELAKLDIERVKGSTEAQIAYIEAMDAQDLRTKVANIDRITELRIQGAQQVARIEDNQLQRTFDATRQLLEANRAVLEKAGVDVDAAIEARRAEMTAKQAVIDQRAVDETQKYRLEGWKRANDAIIEDQKRVYEAFKSGFDEIFDAFTQRTKSIGQALGDVFRKLALGEVRNIFSSQAAAFATEAAGYGRPVAQITRGGGILGTLLQRGMPPRPPGPPPEAYTPTRVESGLTFDMQGSANRFAIGVDTYDVATLRFAEAVGAFGGATVSHQGSANRMADSADTISTASDVFQQASAATGVSQPLLRAVAQVESAMRPGAVSPRGAMGLMQLMPGTARDLGVTQPFNPQQNVMGGAQYLQRLLDRYGGDVPSALAAYNMGPAAFERTMARGAALPAETQRYVQQVQALVTQGAMQEAAPQFARATRQFQLPPGFSMEGGQLTYSPQAAGVAPPALDTGALTLGPTPAEAAQARQGSVLAQLAPILRAGGVGAMGGGAPRQIPSISQLGQLFGIYPGATSVASILTSRAAGTAAMLGGTALVARGLQQRNAPATTIGGGLAGAGYFLTNPQLMARVSEMPGGIGAGLGAGVAAGAGLGLFASGFQRGGGAGLGMAVGGGALAGAGIGFMAGGPIGAAIGAGIGAAAGLVTGIVRLFVQTEQERIRSQIKQVYGVDISNRQILTQIQQIVDQKYGGSVSVGVRSNEVMDLVRLYALSTGQAANMPRPMYAATIAQSTQGLQLQPVYQGGVQVQNPYTGPTTYQYQTAVATAMGLRAGTSLGVPGASGLITQQWQQLALQTIQGNPSAIAMASAAAASAGDSRLTTTQAMQEPLTALS
jgi:hypothetical protein